MIRMLEIATRAAVHVVVPFAVALGAFAQASGRDDARLAQLGAGAG